MITSATVAATVTATATATTTATATVATSTTPTTTKMVTAALNIDDDAARNTASERKTITDGTDNETFGDGHKDSKPSAITGLFSDKSDVYDVNEFGLLTQYHPPYPPHTYGPPPKKKVASKKKVKPKKKHQLYVVPYWDDVAIGPLIDPNDNNVLCGRGGHINHHAGNKQFLRIICSKQWEY